MDIILFSLPVLGIILRVLGLHFGKIAKAYLYISFFSVIFVVSSSFFPFIGGKDFFFRVAVELALASAILWWGFEAKPGEFKRRFERIIRAPLFIAVSCFVLAMILATIFAHDPRAAFWSNYERGEGGFQMLHYYIFFSLLLFFFEKREDWDLGLKAALSATVLMILYGVASLLNIQNFIGPELCNRFQGSLGNPAYVAPYLIFSIFYLFYLWFEKPKHVKTHAKGLLIAGAISGGLFALLVVLNSSFLPTSLANIFRFYTEYAKERPNFNLAITIFVYALFPIIYGAYLLKKKITGSEFVKEISFAALLSSFFFFFLLTQTRGAFLGIGAGIIIGLGYALFLPFARNVKRWILVALMLVFAAGAFAFQFRSHSIPLVPFCSSSSRLANISTEERTAQTRFWTWGTAVRGWQERPLFGWGQENFSTVFDKHFDERHFLPNQGSETWFDRAHGVIFDYLATTGVVGLASYLLVFLVFLYQLIWKKKTLMNVEEKGGKLSETQRELSAFGKVIFLALPAAYFVQALVLFDVLPIYLNLFFFLAFSTYLFSLTSPTRHE